jgi:hypothetical protein
MGDRAAAGILGQYDLALGRVDRVNDLADRVDAGAAG